MADKQLSIYRRNQTLVKHKVKLVDLQVWHCLTFIKPDVSLQIAFLLIHHCDNYYLVGNLHTRKKESTTIVSNMPDCLKLALQMSDIFNNNDVDI